MSTPAMIIGSEIPEKDAALSLCAMGHVIVPEESKASEPVQFSMTSSATSIHDPNLIEDDLSRSSDYSSVAQPKPKVKISPKKRAKKHKESKRQPKVSFEGKQSNFIHVIMSFGLCITHMHIILLLEMKRLMRVYGSTKCLRNRTPKESGKCTKSLSVKRKFYRWFPDFQERFVLQMPGAWYMPKIGHEAEMKYREELRKKDQEVIAAKRNAKKKGFET